jgi:GT2 family glycosyltransferase
MDNGRPKLSVVIVSYNTKAMTVRCLANLTERISGFEAEVFVVDNRSSDGSADEIAVRFPDCYLTRNEQNRGFGAANNQAIRIASGDFILLLNSDAFPHSDAIEALVRYLETNPRAAVVGPRLLNEDGSLQRSCHRFTSPLRAMCDQLLISTAIPRSRLFGNYRTWAHDEQRMVDVVIGACMLVRREAIERVGLFDEDFFLYAEETDWCKRFQNAGWHVGFTPSAIVTHLNGASGKAQADRVFTEFHRGQERFVRKHYCAAGLFWYRLMVVCGALIRIISFGVAGILLPAKRAKLFELVHRWSRLLRWTMGQRGPGLSELQKEANIASEMVCV